MLFEQSLHEVDTLFHWNVRQPQEARVGESFLEDELTEVFVHSNEDALFGRRLFENRFVSRVLAPFRGLDDVVSLVPKPPSKSVAGTPIHQELHFVNSMAWSESCAITACAYAIQARISSASKSG